VDPIARQNRNISSFEETFCLANENRSVSRFYQAQPSILFHIGLAHFGIHNVTGIDLHVVPSKQNTTLENRSVKVLLDLE
jgi:hypothetical protein